MLRNITTFHTLASASVERTAGGSADGQKITYNVIKARLGELLYKITSQKFEDPADGEEAIKCGPAYTDAVPRHEASAVRSSASRPASANEACQ